MIIIHKVAVCVKSRIKISLPEDDRLKDVAGREH